MAKFHLQTSNDLETKFVFVCLACGNCHWIRTKGPQPCWTLTGTDENRPTVAPSILVKGTVPITDEEHARIMRGEKFDPVPFVCHSYIRDGKIEYLGDCTHKLAGQTIELPDFDSWVAGKPEAEWYL